jgi:hypothetical protein
MLADETAIIFVADFRLYMYSNYYWILNGK